MAGSGQDQEQAFLQLIKQLLAGEKTLGHTQVTFLSLYLMMSHSQTMQNISYRDLELLLKHALQVGKGAFQTQMNLFSIFSFAQLVQ